MNSNSSQPFDKLNSISNNSFLQNEELESYDSSSYIFEEKKTHGGSNVELSKNIFNLEKQIENLVEQVKILRDEKHLITTKNNSIIANQLAEETLEKIVQEGLIELKKQKQTLTTSIEKLEHRRNKIHEEMSTNFAGVSEDLAIKVQGFKKYLVGSLQDLAETAEQLDLSISTKENSKKISKNTERPPQNDSLEIYFATKEFRKQHLQIEKAIKNYQKEPNYYGAPWHLRRTFKTIHAEKVKEWFFLRSGKGAVNSTGNRLHDMLVASAIISILGELYGNNNRILILASAPERLGGWRRGLQDCLGISRGDFGPDKGITLFESSEILVQRAKRLIDNKFLPFIIIDEAEEQVSPFLLQFPLYIAFLNCS
ncbi:MAG: Protein of unknown function (DUF3086) [Candidatus Atelocyanobacterium thalassa isolate SIO64986]|uniref:DUF3086 domain-containing protein n=1 Tax=Candidatus Atelocyanobacterium thalassa isolate SIO64986 TaxID=1527444 RepID=A0A086CIG1_9CHRO|nr:MAG: Protein of unknown function (DUF3086) [Candidatus Atelocyanobacterium thalassa isolate SIO64986]